MFRIIILFLLNLFANSTLIVPAMAATPQEVDQPALPTREQCQELIESALPTIVQFSYEGLHHGCGVIVSPEGHVAICGPVSAVLDNKLLELRLTDGRRVRGEALGWSREFGVGMLKISEPGEWKPAKIANEAKAGEFCLALGYPRDHDDNDDHRPRHRLGLVRQVYKNHWFETSYQSDFSAHPAFNMKGELLGMQCISDGVYSTHSIAAMIQKHRDELISGVNIDRKRLFEDIKPPQRVGDLPATIGDNALARAKAASVQIGEVGKKPFFSGVIVPGGYVITCAHHKHLPGKHLEITLADGRSANVVVRGTNRLTDTCLLKITDPGEWPSVNLGYSCQPPLGKSAVLIGYPVKNDSRPLVKDLKIVESPKDGLRRRDDLSDIFFLECNDEDIVFNLRGASGGGVFDSAGNVVGVLSSSTGGKTHDGIFDGELFIARVELFHRNWDSLASDSRAEEVDKERLESTLPGLTKLMSELKVPR